MFNNHRINFGEETIRSFLVDMRSKLLHSIPPLQPIEERWTHPEVRVKVQEREHMEAQILELPCDLSLLPLQLTHQLPAIIEHKPKKKTHSGTYAQSSRI